MANGGYRGDDRPSGTPVVVWTVAPRCQACGGCAAIAVSTPTAARRRRSGPTVPGRSALANRRRPAGRPSTTPACSSTGGGLSRCCSPPLLRCRSPRWWTRRGWRSRRPRDGATGGRFPIRCTGAHSPICSESDNPNGRRWRTRAGLAFAGAFFVAPGRCFRMITRPERLGQPNHCQEPVVWRGVFTDGLGRR